MNRVNNIAMNLDTINKKYAGKWVGVLYNEDMFLDGDRIVVAVGNDTEADWNLICDYIETLEEHSYTKRSVVFGNPNKYKEDLFSV